MDAIPDPVAYWNGPAADRWTRDEEALDRAFAAVTAKLFDVAALQAKQRVLDVGCGCGTSTLLAADAVGAGGAVVGVDVSAPMLARAIERASPRANVSFMQADAAEAPFERSFDVVLSRFGVMFFVDPVRAFTNLRAALRAEGRAVFACWRSMDENEWVRVPYDAAAPYLPPAAPSPPDQPGPFSFGDRARVEGILDAAGFSRVDLAPFDTDVVLADVARADDAMDEAVRFAMSGGPTARRLKDAPDETKARAEAAVTAALADRARGGRVALGGAVWLVTARA